MAICSFFQIDKKMMTVQSIQCHVEDDCIGRTDDVAAQLVQTWHIRMVTCGLFVQ
jgi:hypothetical protein